MNEQVRFARKRFGRIRGDRFSGGAREATPSAENARWKSSTSGSTRLPSRSWPGRERERFPSRSALSRFLAALTETPVEALRTLLTSRSRESPTRPCLHREANRRPGGSRRKHLGDRKSTRLNSSHRTISYAVFCLKKKKKQKILVSLKKNNKKKNKIHK